MANELLELVLDELPDAFRRAPGTAVDKVKAFVKFFQQGEQELQDAYAVLPDSLSRSLPERIRILLDRANNEAGLAVKLRNRLEQISETANDTSVAWETRLYQIKRYAEARDAQG